MKPFKTHYENLKVSWDAPPEVIRSAYKALVNKYHPDRNPNCERSLRIMQIINASYEVLSDETKRREHDQWIQARSNELQPTKTQAFSTSQAPPQTTSAPVQTKQNSKNSTDVGGCGCLLIGIAFTAVFFWTTYKTDSTKPASKPIPTFTPSPPRVATTPSVSKIALTELPLPKAGQLTAAANQSLLAPFEVKSSNGLNYFMKLVDANSGREVLTVFIRGGTPVEIKAPVGSFVVKYATGVKWYGEEFLFGPETQYAQASEIFEFTREISPSDLDRLLRLNREISIFDVNFKQFLLHQGMPQKTANYLFDQEDSNSREHGLDRISNSWWKQNVLLKIKDVRLANEVIDKLNNRVQLSNQRNRLQAMADNVNGYSITLYKVRNGNLQTKSISKNDF